MWCTCPGMRRPDVNVLQASLQQRLIERKLTDAEIDQLSVMSMSGVAAEAQTYEEVSVASTLKLRHATGTFTQISSIK